MRELLSDLNLDVDTIERDLDVCKGLALAYETSVEETSDEDRIRFVRLVSATYFRRAAAHSLLLGDPDEAKKHFSSAARVYATLQMPYGLMMSAFIPEPPPDLLNIEYAWTEKPYDLQSIYLLLFHTATGRRYEINTAHLQYIRENLHPYRSYPVGILGLPLGSYIDLAGYLDHQTDRRDVSLEEAVLPFLNGYSMAIRRARQKSYHWRRLALPFHPAEPDMFSVILLVESAIRMRNQTLNVILDAFPLSWESRALLNGIVRQYF